jgi:hydrogenase maturation protease
MKQSRVLIAGIGNIFLGDDAFGVEAVRRLLKQPLPEGVRAADFGIRGFDLACAMLDGYDAVILVDAACRGGLPGTLRVIEPEVTALTASDAAPAIERHSLDPAKVFQHVQALGGKLPILRLVGCEPASFGTDEEPQMGLSPAVAQAVEQAVPLIHALLSELRTINEDATFCR